MENSYKYTTNSNICFHRPQSPNSRVEQELIEKSSRAVNSATDPLEKLRFLCLSHGASGIISLGRIFRKMDEDEDCSKQLSKEDFLHGIKETGLELSKEEAEELFHNFVVDNTGTINLDEFLKQLRPPMSEPRRTIVEQAFNKMDKTGSGVISIQDVRRVYSATAYPRYMSGEETADVILKRFLANFEQEGVVDGKITAEDFMNYYSGISVSIEDDTYFNLMMRQMYRL